MGIKIEKMEDIYDGIPFCNGFLKIKLLTEVSGDEPDEEGNKELLYKDGKLHNNYVFAWESPVVGKPCLLGLPESFTKVFGIYDHMADSINDYFANKLSGEIAVMPIAFVDEMGIVFANTIDVYADIYGKDSDEYKELLKGAPEQDEKAAEERIMELVENGIYIKNVFAKMAHMLETAFNETHFTSKASEIANIIMQSRYLDAKGEIRALDVADVDKILNGAKERIMIKSSPVDFFTTKTLHELRETKNIPPSLPYVFLND